MPKRPSTSHSALSVKFEGAIVLGGPADSELTARRRLAQLLYEGYAEGVPDVPGFAGMGACYYFDQTGMGAVWADKIAFDPRIRYQVRGRKIVVRVQSLTVQYRNGNGPWKWWVRIAEHFGDPSVEIGDLV